MRRLKKRIHPIEYAIQWIFFALIIKRFSIYPCQLMMLKVIWSTSIGIIFRMIVSREEAIVPGRRDYSDKEGQVFAGPKI